MYTLLQLLLAHILADFFLQNKKMVNAKRGKGARRWAALAGHSLLHAITAYVLVGEWHSWQIPAVLFTTHFVIDSGKIRIGRDSLGIFLKDQCLHLMVVVGLWLWLMPGNLRESLSLVVDMLPSNCLPIVVAYALMLRPTAILLALILKRWQLGNMTAGSLPEAGKWIGYLERMMTLTFVLTGHIEGVGFLLAAKSVFRFGDLKEAKDIKTTEYVMIGTMWSFAIAIAAGLLVS